MNGIPITTSSRTLLDLATVLRPRELEKAIGQAEVLRLADPLCLAELVARHPGRSGVVVLRSLLEAGRIGATVTRSELEDRFLTFLATNQLPRPEVNVALEVAGRWIKVDCLWRAARVVVELDGYASHGTRSAFERDRARDRRLQTADWRVVRITWRHLTEDPGALASELRSVLGPARKISSCAA